MFVLSRRGRDRGCQPCDGQDPYADGRGKVCHTTRSERSKKTRAPPPQRPSACAGAATPPARDAADTADGPRDPRPRSLQSSDEARVLASSTAEAVLAERERLQTGVAPTDRVTIGRSGGVPWTTARATRRIMARGGGVVVVVANASVQFRPRRRSRRAPIERASSTVAAAGVGMSSIVVVGPEPCPPSHA